jgi:hypothetical protein
MITEYFIPNTLPTGTVQVSQTPQGLFINEITQTCIYQTEGGKTCFQLFCKLS